MANDVQKNRRKQKQLRRWLAITTFAAAQVLFVAHVYTHPFAVPDSSCEACLIGGSAVPAVDTAPAVALRPVHVAPVVEFRESVLVQPVLYSGSPRAPPANLLYS